MSKQQRSGSAKHTKTTLSIEQKLKVLDCAKENPKESCRTLSTKFSVGKTQIAAILKNETELRAAYATYRGNNPGNNKRARQGRYQEINEALYKWYSLARESLVPINGPMLQEEGTEIAKQLAKPECAEFKASSGWLEKWKNPYGISQRSIEGESADYIDADDMVPFCREPIDLSKVRRCQDGHLYKTDPFWSHEGVRIRER